MLISSSPRGNVAAGAAASSALADWRKAAPKDAVRRASCCCHMFPALPEFSRECPSGVRLRGVETGDSNEPALAGVAGTLPSARVGVGGALLPSALYGVCCSARPGSRLFALGSAAK